MSNVSRRLQAVAVKEGESVFNIGQLLAEKEANKDNTEFTSKLDELMSIGQGKGIAFEFVTGEVITFDSFEDSVIVVRYTELNGKKYAMLSVVADSSVRGKDLEIPISIFRRVPALVEDRATVVKDHSLNEKLMRSSLSDLKRLEELAGKKLSVDNALYLAKVSFKNVNGRNVRVDVKSLPEEERDKMYFYQVSYC